MVCQCEMSWSKPFLSGILQWRVDLPYLECTVERKIFMTFNLLIRTYRCSSVLTQEGFAEKLEVEPRTVQRWEKGGNIPRGATVARMRLLNAALFDELWLLLVQYELQQLVSDVIRSRRFRS